LLDPELAGEEVATGAGDEADGEEATGDGAAGDEIAGDEIAGGAGAGEVERTGAGLGVGVLKGQKKTKPVSVTVVTTSGWV
jgi:hypothetical protein